MTITQCLIVRWKALLLVGVVHILGCIQLAKLHRLLIHVMPESSEMLVEVGVVVNDNAFMIIIRVVKLTMIIHFYHCSSDNLWICCRTILKDKTTKF